MPEGNEGRRSERSFVVVPRTGQKEALDAWLEGKIAGDTRTVLTYDSYDTWITEAMNRALFALSLMEGTIAVMAALALAGLNSIFVRQRQAEFGVLHALGFSCRQLVRRVARETLLTTGAAWLLGILGCAAIVAYLHYEQYTPLGWQLDFFNLAPWLYTLPVPVAVLLVSAGAVAWALSRLEPVAVIERR